MMKKERVIENEMRMEREWKGSSTGYSKKKHPFMIEHKLFFDLPRYQNKGSTNK